MNILFLSSYVNPKSGASILIRLADQLKQNGHNVHIITTTPGYDSDIIKSVRLPIGVRQLNRIFNKFIPNYFSLIYPLLLKEIQTIDPDVINVHWTHGATIPISLISKLNETRPVLWTLHDEWPITANTYFEYVKGDVLLEHKKSMLQIFKQQLKFSSKLLYRYKVRTLGNQHIRTISPSRWLQQKVENSPVFLASTNFHIPNGVDTELFRPLDRSRLRNKYGIADSEKVVLFLSANTADERKGLYYFVKAMECLKKEFADKLGSITTVLVGRNSDGINKLLPGKVVNLGSTNEVYKLAEYYNLTDVFVSASIADNFPSTLLESLACGTPIVAFDVGGVSEIAIHGKTGLLAESRNINDMATCIYEVLINRTLRSELSANCRSYALECFSMDKFVDSYLSIFQKSKEEGVV